MARLPLVALRWLLWRRERDALVVHGPLLSLLALFRLPVGPNRLLVQPLELGGEGPVGDRLSVRDEAVAEELAVLVVDWLHPHRPIEVLGRGLAGDP
jgi:hypothetical protein